jgi:hypothetical protein
MIHRQRRPARMWGGVFQAGGPVGIDHVIHYDCEAKQTLTVENLIDRIKGRDRARIIIRLYHDEGDHRLPSQMGFQMVRRLPDGTEETEIIRVQDLLDAAEELARWEPACTGCPANRAGSPFGCISAINYPISAQAERWLLDQMPDQNHLLSFVLLQKTLCEMGYTGESAAPLRQREGMFWESVEPLARDMGSFQVSGDQVFELLFLSGPIYPAHGSLLLLFFGGISQDLDADTLMQLASPPSRDWIQTTAPLLLAPHAADDESIHTLKDFFAALHTAYRLGVPLLLDV